MSAICWISTWCLVSWTTQYNKQRVFSGQLIVHVNKYMDLTKGNKLHQQLFPDIQIQIQIQKALLP